MMIARTPWNKFSTLNLRAPKVYNLRVVEYFLLSMRQLMDQP